MLLQAIGSVMNVLLFSFVIFTISQIIIIKHKFCNSLG